MPGRKSRFFIVSKGQFVLQHDLRLRLFAMSTLVPMSNTKSTMPCAPPHRSSGVRMKAPTMKEVLDLDREPEKPKNADQDSAVHTRLVKPGQ